jgi:hypothetical protein
MRIAILAVGVPQGKPCARGVAIVRSSRLLSVKEKFHGPTTGRHRRRHYPNCF